MSWCRRAALNAAAQFVAVVLHADNQHAGPLENMLADEVAAGRQRHVLHEPGRRFPSGAWRRQARNKFTAKLIA